MMALIPSTYALLTYTPLFRSSSSSRRDPRGPPPEFPRGSTPLCSRRILSDARTPPPCAQGGGERASERIHREHSGVDPRGNSDRKSTRLNSSHGSSSYYVFFL